MPASSYDFMGSGVTDFLGGGRTPKPGQSVSQSSLQPVLPPAYENFPSWMPRQAPVQPLQQFGAALPSYFNLAPLRKQLETGIQSMQGQQRQNANAAATAMMRRSMQAGGTGAGASFAAAQAMLPANNVGNQMRLQFGDLAARMRAQQAGLAGSNAAALTNAYGQHTNTLADYAARQQAYALQGQQNSLERERMGQQNRQFYDNLGLQQDQLGLQAMQMRLANRGPGPMANFNVDTMGKPLSVGDAVVQNQYQNALQAWGGGYGGGGAGVRMNVGFGGGGGRRAPGAGAPQNLAALMGASDWNSLQGMAQNDWNSWAAMQNQALRQAQTSAY